MSQEVKLLRLREPGAGAHSGDQVLGSGAVVLEYWHQKQWQPVAVDEDFVQAFASEAEPVVAGSVDAQVAVPEAEPAPGLSLEFEPGERGVLLVPGTWVWNGLETVPRAARRQSQAVGYMVEEQLAEDVEDLHFVCEPVQGELCSVMAVASLKLAILKSQFERLGWPVTVAIPEYRLLANTGAESAVWFDGERVHFWHVSGRGLSVNRPLAGVIAESLFVADATAPGADSGGAELAIEASDSLPLRVMGDATELERATLEQLGTANVVDEAPEDQFVGTLGTSVPGNLLSGPYQVALQSAEGPWWKKPAIALAACFVLQLVFFVGAGTYFKIKAANAEAAARDLFSEIFPDDSPSADLRRQITGYLNQSSGGGGEFAGQLQQLSSVWGGAKSGELKLQSLRFDGNRGELVLQLRAANLGQLDSVVSKLGQGQFKAELLAANELEEGVSGRIRLR
ncbi:type II secretion system protein GspL [Microbulbifer sp. HZ11]|uniref:type II secretion system protein GspL n=1 Tax=Microbulbifer sp. HZ11 TaxID=1453501 RepID=UPI0005BE6A4E|nr:type II secretion system protein GspL [Microbulbifer sp. HZ11]